MITKPLESHGTSALPALFPYVPVRLRSLLPVSGSSHTTWKEHTLKKKKLLFYSMGISVMTACVIGAPHVCNTHGGSRKMLDPLELELQTIVNCHVDAGTQTRIL